MKEMWDQRFAGEEYVYGTLPNQFFKEKIEQAWNPVNLFYRQKGKGEMLYLLPGWAGR